MKHTLQVLTTLLTTVSLTYGGSVFAAPVSEEFLGNAFQEMKNYLGLMQGNQREHENLLRSVPPPQSEITEATGVNMKANEPDIDDYKVDMANGIIFWNMLQNKDNISNSNFVAQHLTGYCSEEERNAHLCSAGLSVQQGGAADLLIDTLLANPTIVYDSAAIAFVYNLTNPTPIPLPENAFTGEDVYTDYIKSLDGSPMQMNGVESLKLRQLTPDGIRTLSERYKQMALLSTAQYAMQHIVADRQKIVGLGSQMGLQKPDISLFELLEYESNRRFNDKTWHEEINKVPDTALLREIANMQAVQLALDFKRYEQDQIITSLLAAQVSMNAKSYGQAEAAMQMQ